MEFVVFLLFVLAIMYSHVFARPTDMDFTKDGINVGESNEQFKYMLPVAAYNLGENYTIEICGILNRTHENFAAMLLSGVEESTSCKLRFNYETNEGLEISPGLQKDKELIKYQMADVQNTTLNPPFTLTLRAMVNMGVKMFIIILDNSGVGSCEVDSLDNLSHIVFKEGVKKIESLKFTL